jgi:hypothetical protein
MGVRGRKRLFLLLVDKGVTPLDGRILGIVLGRVLVHDRRRKRTAT